MTEVKRWRQLVPKGTLHHQAVVLFLPGRPARLHTHDFPEVFWIERGRGYHQINAQRKALHSGDLVFVRPEDVHTLEAEDSEGFTLVNVAFEPALRDSLVARHPKELGSLFAARSRLPHRSLLPTEAMPVLRRQLDSLSRHPQSQVAIEHFLLGLHEHIRGRETENLPSMPDWLREACEKARHPAVFNLGAPGFARAAGRSAEHVARSARIYLGTTPSDFVNRIRMEFAARELRITARPIADIANDCGLANLSHFYALFRTAHGRTPRGYRIEHSRAVA